MERILIIGSNASGKTTMAKELSDKLKLPLIHMDKLYRDFQGFFPSELYLQCDKKNS